MARLTVPATAAPFRPKRGNFGEFLVRNEIIIFSFEKGNHLSKSRINASVQVEVMQSENSSQ